MGWTKQGNIKGSRGPQGATGARGSTGSKGATGASGVAHRTSNAHGVGIKFTDGTLICYLNDRHNVTIDKATGHIFQDGGKVFSFPVAFKTTPVVVPMSQEIGGSGGWQTVKNINTKAVTLHMFSSRAGATGRYGYIAIGVWK